MKSRKLWTATLCLALVIATGGHRAWAAGPEPQLEARLLAEGWTKIDEGVFERKLGATKVEHLGLGREGFVWTIGELHRWREALMREHEARPSEDLARLIENLGQRIAEAAQEVRTMPRGQEASAAFTGGSCGDICYGASADAFYLTSEQGVSAVADAKLTSACGFTGNTYAYACARATLNGTTTTTCQEDPDTGTSITSHAAATVKGGNSATGILCYSEANSYAQSTTLGISYTTSDRNDLCPAPPLGVTITGATSVSFTSASCVSRTWSTTVTGGTPPYSYQWYFNSTPVGTASSYTRSVCYNHANFRLEVVVTDSSNPAQTARDAHDVFVFYEPDPCPGGCCPGDCCFNGSSIICP